MRRALLLAATAALAGCTVGPNYSKPEIATPARYAEPAPAPGMAVDLAHWWQAYDDPELDRLVQIALADNLDVKTAISRVREARLGIVTARAQGLPQVNAAANGQYSNSNNRIRLHRDNIEEAVTGVLGQVPAGVTLPKTFNPPAYDNQTYSAGFDASWQLDVFGGVRRGVEAARAQADAAEWNVRDAQVTLVSEVADAYLQLRQFQAQEQVAQAEIARQRRSLQILENTAKVGLVPEGNFTRQRAQLASALATVGPLQAQEAAQVHAIAVLIAKNIETVAPELSFYRPDPPAPPAVPPGIPSELLRRRPDVRAAERQLAAATAEIGVATADLYPSFSLTGAAQLMSQALGNFLTITGRQLTGAGSAQFPILDWGRRRAAVGMREEQREQAYLAYQQTVLSAMRDVEDALARIATEQGRNEALRKGVADAERSVQAESARFQTGLANQTEVLDAQAAVLQQRNQLAESDGSLRRDVAALYRALGGGWDENEAVAPGGTGRREAR